jgi:ORF6N domain
MPARRPTPTDTRVIARSIILLRAQKVLLDTNLAEIYGVTTKALNQAVKRNADRFPEDFVFQLTAREALALNRSQSVTGAERHRNVRYLPMAFTEHGAIMAATILKSRRAVETSVFVVRAFVQLRELLASNTDLARRLTILESRVARRLGRHDEEITAIIKLIRQMMATPQPAKQRPIGFTADIGGDN